MRQWEMASARVAVAASLCDAQSRAVITRASRRPQGDDYRLCANRAKAAHARKCMRQETATEPSTGSIPEFSKSERAGPVRLPVADEQHDRSCPMRSWSPRSYARRDLRPCERADVIAVKRSAQARRRKPRKRKSQQMRVRDLLNARTGSLRSRVPNGGPESASIF